VSETVAVAKKDLKAGEYLDGIGGYTVYGLIDTYDNAEKKMHCP
jgi:predicted homoserine dehydrogenase-like protein